MFAFRIHHTWYIRERSISLHFFRGKFRTRFPYFILFLRNDSVYIHSSRGVPLNTSRSCFFSSFFFLWEPKITFKTFLSLYYYTILLRLPWRYHYASLYHFKFRCQNKRLLYNITSSDVSVRCYNNRLRGNGQTHEQCDILVCTPETFFGE